MPGLVSVIMPAHQSAGFIATTLRRVLEQTYGDLEVVVVDNGSTDGTGEVVARIGDERVRYHWQPDSGLPANSRNVAISMAKGEWLAFCDADDVWCPEKLDRVVTAFETDPGVDVVCHAVRVVSDGRETGRRSYTPDTSRMFEELLYRGNMLTTSATVVKTSALARVETPVPGPFSEDPAKRSVEDYDLWLRFADAGGRFLFLPDLLGEWVVHEDSTSADLDRHYEALFGVYDEWFTVVAARGGLSLSRALWRLTRSTLASARDSNAGMSKTVWRLPAQLSAAARRYRAAAPGRGRGDAR